jgi:phosphoribosyl-ATP pyrophosphohydrolase
LDRLSGHNFEALSILTFDSAKLGTAHLGNNAHFAPLIIGLNPNAHLRTVISDDGAVIDIDRAGRETVETVRAATTNQLDTLLLECTNLPPYKGALRSAFDIEIIDILTEIERVRPHTIQPTFL